ncbi:transposable element Tc3 transposase [Trichonephila clavipes]|nr:transposable element Tc3 transposase [Trichonephila clavipes]
MSPAFYFKSILRLLGESSSLPSSHCRSGNRKRVDRPIVASCETSPKSWDGFFGLNLFTDQSGTLFSVSCVSSCQVIYSQFGLAVHQNDHQARRRFVEWAQNEIAVVPDFHKRILLSDEAHFWLNGYVNKQNCRIWSEANPQVYVETPLHPEKLTVGCALWAGGIFLQKR